MGACARIISHTGASNGDAVTASHMTTKRTPRKTKHETRRKKGQDIPTMWVPHTKIPGYLLKYQIPITRTNQHKCHPLIIYRILSKISIRLRGDKRPTYTA